MIIDNEFEQLIPPLTDYELKNLEDSIIAEGCRDPLVVWGDILIDGHNRYKICSKHDIKFNTIQISFNSRDEALLWIMRNQLSRRNLNDLQRVELVRKCENAVKAQARERQLAGLVQNDSPVVENFPQREDAEQTGQKSRDELGAMAGVSGKTYEHAIEILDKAPATVADAVRKKELSIDAGYKVTKMPEEQQDEIAKRIEQGEKPKNVIAEVKKTRNTTQESSNNLEKHKIISINLETEFKRDNLVKMHIENLVANDCALFLWCQYHMLSDIFKSSLFEKWGLTYKTVAFLFMEADKTSELCILAIRGNPISTDTLLPRFIDASGKDFVGLIKEVVGDIPVYELS